MTTIAVWEGLPTEQAEPNRADPTSERKNQTDRWSKPNAPSARQDEKLTAWGVGLDPTRNRETWRGQR